MEKSRRVEGRYVVGGRRFGGNMSLLQATPTCFNLKKKKQNWLNAARLSFVKTRGKDAAKKGCGSNTQKVELIRLVILL